MKSLDIILDAYKEIEERLPTFMKYKALFETNPELRKALEFYFCDILEFHFHALRFLNRPGKHRYFISFLGRALSNTTGWKKLFESAWKTFDTHFRRILDSLDRHRALIESEKGTLAVVEAQKAREIAEIQSKEAVEREDRNRLRLLIERLDPADHGRDQYAASEQRRQSHSGQWLWQNQAFQQWCDVSADCNPLIYLHGVPGAGQFHRPQPSKCRVKF